MADRPEKSFFWEQYLKKIKEGRSERSALDDMLKFQDRIETRTGQKWEDISKGFPNRINYTHISDNARTWGQLRQEKLRQFHQDLYEAYIRGGSIDQYMYEDPFEGMSEDEIEWHLRERKEDHERGLLFGYAGPYLHTNHMAYKLPKYIQSPHLVLRKEEFVFAFPFDEGAVNDLKRLPLNQRKWDPRFRLWRLSPTKDVLLFVIELSQKFYGTDPVLMTDGVTVDEIIRGKTVDNSTFYSVLGVKNNATAEELKRAFRQKATEYHPDKGGDVENFHKIRVAYETLKEPKKRKRYDAALKMMAGQKTNVAKVYRKAPFK